jgi:hypothetical protein
MGLLLLMSQLNFMVPLLWLAQTLWATAADRRREFARRIVATFFP